MEGILFHDSDDDGNIFFTSYRVPDPSLISKLISELCAH